MAQAHWLHAMLTVHQARSESSTCGNSFNPQFTVEETEAEGMCCHTWA